MGDYTAFFYGKPRHAPRTWKMELTLFTGTLMAPGVLHRVIHGTHSPEQWQKDLITTRPAMLQNYRRHRVRWADYPAIIPHDNSQVRGSFVTGLTEGDIRRLDIFEGDQYKRSVVKVQVLKNVELDQAAPEGDSAKLDVLEEVEAQTYVWLEDPDATLEPQEWDFEAFKKDKMRAWMGIDESEGVAVDEGFADVDKAVAGWDQSEQGNQSAKKDRDPMGGRGANGHITQQLHETPWA